MVTEGAFGELKGSWRILSRKCKSTVSTVKAVTLACVVLHNLCIERGDVTLRHWDITNVPERNERRPTELVRDMLHMIYITRIRDNSKQAGKIRDILKRKFHDKKQNTV